MFVAATVLAVALVMMVIEATRPGRSFPKVANWYVRAFALNGFQAVSLLTVGRAADGFFQAHRPWSLDGLGPVGGALVGYLIHSFVYYWWHRWRHTSQFWWNVCHQLHHSPRRIEIITSFYKHPVEITLNSILSSVITFALLGVTVQAAALYTVLAAVAEFFYHWNVRTPTWLGPVFQRPESHRVHHKKSYHTNNYADLPVFDILFGTYENPRTPVAECGFTPEREDRFEDLIAFRDLHDKKVAASSPLHFLPTCIGCGKRWACHEARVGERGEQASAPPRHTPPALATVGARDDR